MTREFESGELVLSTFPLNVAEPEREALEALLDDEERSRAQRFVFDGDRRRFAVARARLRQILAHFVPCAAEAVRFEYGANGKPSLAGGDSALQFNIAHSDELALVGLSNAGQVGVDLELMKSDFDYESIVRSHFHRNEALRLFAHDDGRLAEFFQLWTCKEALLKASGQGMSVDLAAVEFELDAGGEAHLLSAPHEFGPLERWKFHCWSPAPWYAAAACFDPACRLLHLELDELGAHAARRRERST